MIYGVDKSLILEAAEFLKDEKELDLPVEKIANLICAWLEEKLDIADIDHLYYYDSSLRNRIEEANNPYAIARENEETAATERQLEIAA